MKIKQTWEGMQLKVKGAGIMKDGELTTEAGVPAVEGLEVQIGGCSYEAELSVEEMAQGLKNVREIMEIICEYIPKIKKAIEDSFVEPEEKGGE